MDDWLRNYSTTPEVDERLSFAAKIANVSAINSGQMDTSPANLGTVSWSYQAMKGNVYVNSFEPSSSKLHDGWRQMAGEADLGLFGAIRILSSDVVVDPTFGLYGYGCNVQESAGCYAITPEDGVFKRLNLITQKFHMDLDRDRYIGATVSNVERLSRLHAAEPDAFDRAYNDVDDDGARPGNVCCRCRWHERGHDHGEGRPADGRLPFDRDSGDLRRSDRHWLRWRDIGDRRRRWGDSVGLRRRG